MPPDAASSIENGQRHLDERPLRKVVSIEQPSATEQPGTTEDAIALEFVRRHVRDVLFVPNVGFHTWEGHRWRRDTKSRHCDAARRLCRELGNAARHRWRQATYRDREDRERGRAARAHRPAHRPDRRRARRRPAGAQLAGLDHRSQDRPGAAPRSRPRDAYHCRLPHSRRQLCTLDPVPAGRFRGRLGRRYLHAPIPWLLPHRPDAGTSHRLPLRGRRQRQVYAAGSRALDHGRLRTQAPGKRAHGPAWRAPPDRGRATLRRALGHLQRNRRGRILGRVAAQGVDRRHPRHSAVHARRLLLVRDIAQAHHRRQSPASGSPWTRR